MMKELKKSFRAALALGCFLVLGACSTSPRYFQASREVDKIEKLASSGKCADAIKIYDEIRKEFTDQPYYIARAATTSVYGFPKCLIDAGRAEEVISHFELACQPDRKTPFSALEQTYICTDYNLKDAAAVAYKAAGRENPFGQGQDVARQMARNKEMADLIDNERIKIYGRTVDQSRYDVGTAAGSRQYHREMRAAAIASISFIDRQIQNCQNQKNSWCLKYLSEQRKTEATNVEVHSQYIKESEEDHAAAQRIARAAPAILGAIAGAGAIYAGANSTPSTQSRPAASSAASEASEVCPLSEPYKSQCDARNAARRGRAPAIQAGGAAHQAVPTQAQGQSGAGASANTKYSSIQQQQVQRPQGSSDSSRVRRVPDATQCVKVRYDKYGSREFLNTCDHAIEIAWCTEDGVSFKCSKGNWGFVAMWTLAPGGSYPTGGQKGAVHFAACGEKNMGPKETGPNMHTCDQS
ncbi:hypothetical protein PGB34_01095 [Xenophilus arseniciresistens]|uniref:Uncharacterized protein n=1 Tax=Xenophilus arseniciresistens TaxID=1283306 RepID=A0AAE3SXA9_9BURK|nr:hypothetical protein [Xenophilus arseniciresistens]MDA7414947.1 hypothetical protein [Xenophilus arseniciresistens]